MSSAIDPSKPADGVAASKADLRANLEAARTEIEHGGFAAGFDPTGYGPPASPRVVDHLAAIDRRLAAIMASAGGGPTGFEDVTAHGAIGDGAADDTAAIQAAIDAAAARGHAGGVVFFPPGRYRVTAPLRLPRMADHASGSGHGVALPPLWFLGSMGGGGANGHPSAGFGGNSVVEVDHAGIGLDLSRASGDARPAWFAGRVENLGFQDVGGASHGIKAYAVMHAQFVNLHLRQFTHNIQVGDETLPAANGGGWYSKWLRVQSFRGRATSGRFVCEMHGAVFDACNFSHSSGVGLQLGNASPLRRAGKPIKVNNCYFEGNAGHAVEVHGAESVHVNGAYAELNAAHVVRFSTSGAQGSLSIRDSYFYLEPGTHVVEADAGAGASIHVLLEGTHVVPKGRGSVAVYIPANPGRVAIADRTSTNSKVEAGRTPAVGLTNAAFTDLRAYDCACSQFHANQAGGALNGRS